MTTKMANTSHAFMPWKHHVICEAFARSFLVFILIALGMVTAGLPNYNEHQHHHSHVCNHQHPKADDVRSNTHNAINLLLLKSNLVLGRSFLILFLLSHSLRLSDSFISYRFIHSFLTIRFRFIMKFYWANFAAIECVCPCVRVCSVFFLDIFKNMFYRIRE